jgi:hypothetical protein
MRRRSSKYSSPDASGWMHKCDDLFLAQFRGLPCEICGKLFTFNNGQKVSSCGHHLIFKGGCRKHRYNKLNIVVLCPQHHSTYEYHISPHSIVNNKAQERFAVWVKENKPDQYAWWQEHEKDANKPFNKSWTYREMYELLGGEIKSKTGLLKDMKPYNHATKIKAITGRE